MAEISFQPITHAHLPLLERWMRAPHWREWWGDPATELSFIVDMLEGRDTSRPFIFLLDGAPTGYIQYWFIGHHQTPEWCIDYPWLAELPADAIGIDLSIGEPHLLGRGIGSRVLCQFVGILAEDGHKTLIIDPDPANRRAVRAYEKAGFRPVPHLAGRTGDTLIMQHHPSAETVRSEPQP